MSASSLPDGRDQGSGVRDQGKTISPLTAAPTPTAKWAREVCAGLAALSIQDVVYVPDNPLSFVLRALGEDHPEIRTTIATREEEAFGIAAGLYLGGIRPAVMLQSSGLG